jgi:enamine deaminase RidA (YjgF/YER057c/UK114 family)
MPGVRRHRISGHSPYEPVFGFSRALVAGDRVLVAGTAPVPPGGGPPPAGPYAQARLCLDLIGEALAKAGTSMEHVVRTRMFLTGAEHWEEVARAHGEVFAAIRPAATAVIVAGLLDPAWLVEIEAEATLPESLHGGSAVSEWFSMIPKDLVLVAVPDPSGSWKSGPVVTVTAILPVAADAEVIESTQRAPA